MTSEIITLNNVNHKNLSCPCCGSKGHSVAAIALKETKQVTDEGDFSVTGIGLGQGLNLGLGSGYFSSAKQEASLRAAIFQKPTKPETQETDSEHFFLPCLFFIFMVMYLFVVDKLFALNLFSKATSSLMLLFSVLTYFFLLFRPSRCSQVSDSTNNEHDKLYAKKINHYNALRYCDNCNILYDNLRQRIEHATESGFEKMLSTKGA